MAHPEFEFGSKENTGVIIVTHPQDRVDFDISQFAISELMYSSKSEEFSRGADSCGKRSPSFLCALRHLWTRNTIEHRNVDHFRIYLSLISSCCVVYVNFSKQIPSVFRDHNETTAPNSIDFIYLSIDCQFTDYRSAILTRRSSITISHPQSTIFD